MADIRIQDLPAGTAVSEKIVAVEQTAGGITERVSLQSIADLGGGGGGNPLPTIDAIYVSTAPLTGPGPRDGTKENPYDNLLDAYNAAPAFFGRIVCGDGSTFILPSTITIAKFGLTIDCDVGTIQSNGSSPAFIVAAGIAFFLNIFALQDTPVSAPTPTSGPLVHVNNGSIFSFTGEFIFSNQDLVPVVLHLGNQARTSLDINIFQGGSAFVGVALPGNGIDIQVSGFVNIPADDSELLVETAAEEAFVSVKWGSIDYGVMDSYGFIQDSEVTPVFSLKKYNSQSLGGPAFKDSDDFVLPMYSTVPAITISTVDTIDTSGSLIATPLSVSYTPRNSSSKMKITVSGYFRVDNPVLVSTPNRQIRVVISRTTGTPVDLYDADMGVIYDLAIPTNTDTQWISTSFFAYEDVGVLAGTSQTYALFIASGTPGLRGSLLGSTGIQCSITAEEIIQSI